MRALEIDSGLAVAQWEGEGTPPQVKPPRLLVDVTKRPDAHVGDTYDEQTDTFTAPAEPPDHGKLVDARQFFLLFTAEERKAIRAAAVTDPDVEDYARLAELSPPIPLRHPMTIAGLQLLVTKGLLDAERVAAISAGEAPK